MVHLFCNDVPYVINSNINMRLQNALRKKVAQIGFLQSALCTFKLPILTLHLEAITILLMIIYLSGCFALQWIGYLQPDRLTSNHFQFARHLCLLLKSRPV